MTRPSFFAPGVISGRQVMLASHRGCARGVVAQDVDTLRRVAAGRAAGSAAARSRRARRPWSTRTRRSYQAAWPVTGSALALRKPSCAGSHSLMTWLSRKPRSASGLSSATGPRRRARLPMAFQVQTVSGLTPSISASWHFNSPGAAFDPDPIVMHQAQRLGLAARHVQLVGAVDLPQPGIHRAPGMVHRHRPLGDGGEVEALEVVRPAVPAARTRWAAGRNRCGCARAGAPAAAARHGPRRRGGISAAAPTRAACTIWLGLAG